MPTLTQNETRVIEHNSLIENYSVCTWVKKGTNVGIWRSSIAFDQTWQAPNNATILVVPGCADRKGRRPVLAAIGYATLQPWLMEVVGF